MTPERRDDMPPIQHLPPRPLPRWLRWAILLGVGGLVLLWLAGTPPGLEGKVWAVGYAICHQIELRTFTAEGVVMPLCARCSGTFLAVLVGFVGPLLMRRGRAGRFPPPLVVGVLLGFTALWAADGFNSFLHLFPEGRGLYTPRNELRLLTGSLQGLTMSGLIYPVFNQSVWQQWRPEPSLRGFKDLGVLVLAVLAVDALVLTRQPVVLAALGYLSVAGVLVILTAIQTVLVVFLTGRANRSRSWRDLAIFVVAGFGLALAMIGAINVLRFSLTGTWAGFDLPG